MIPTSGAYLYRDDNISTEPILMIYARIDPIHFPSIMPCSYNRAISSNHDTVIANFIDGADYLGSARFEKMNIEIQDKGMINLLTNTYEEVSDIISITKDNYNRSHLFAEKQLD